MLKLLAMITALGLFATLGAYSYGKYPPDDRLYLPKEDAAKPKDESSNHFPPDYGKPVHLYHAQVVDRVAEDYFLRGVKQAFSKGHRVEPVSVTAWADTWYPKEVRGE